MWSKQGDVGDFVTVSVRYLWVQEEEDALTGDPPGNSEGLGVESPARR